MFEMNTAATKLTLIAAPDPTWMPKIAGLRHAVDDGADDDAHRATGSFRAEPASHELVGHEEHGDADHHPQARLPPLDVGFGFGQQVERDGRDHRAGTEPAEDADDLRRHRHPADQRPCQKQRGLRKSSPSRKLPAPADPTRRRSLIQERRSSTPTSAGWFVVALQFIVTRSGMLLESVLRLKTIRS